MRLNVLALNLKINDPLEVASAPRRVQGVGLIFNGLFGKEEFVAQVYDSVRAHGVFVAAQAGEVCVRATMGPLFYLLHRLRLLRISIDETVSGFDISSHGGYVYHIDEEVTGPKFYGDYVHQ